MTIGLERLELIRARWRRVRESLQLIDPLSDTFATGGLARHAPEVNVRFLLLPADPGADVMEFDEEFWAWWMQDRLNPFEGASPTLWGRDGMPAATAAVRYDRSDDRWNWDSYLALLRCGGLEFGLGRLGSAVWQRHEQEPSTRVFFLTTIVGRIWVALSLFAEAVTQYEIRGPWELALALRESQLSILANVAAGWAEPEDVFPGETIRRCPDPGLLIVREVFAWPGPEALQALAFSFGANVEDAFGFRERRFLARIGPGAGQLDVSRYRSGR